MRQIFISSVQKELQDFRNRVNDYVSNDPLLSQFFTVFQFEKLPAADRLADDAYLDEVAKTDIYLGLFANEYGWEDGNGLSPTHREFLAATENGVERLIYVVELEGVRHPKMKALINEASDQLIRRRVNDINELLNGIYHSIVEYLGRKGLLTTAAFDERLCQDALLDDISTKRVNWFLSRARSERGFALASDATPEQTLTHLNQLVDGAPTNAAILLFGSQPQKFVPVAEIKCAHHHGTSVQKPIPDYKVFQVDLFDQVDSAVDFVMSKLARSVGTRSESAEAPVEYSVPPEVIAEAIVNAVAHRDYTSPAPVQVAVFSDRVEVRNSGRLPPELTLEQLKVEHASFPRNKQIANTLFLAKYIEQLGTGTSDIYRRCREAGLPEPRFEHVGTEFVFTVSRLESALAAIKLSDRQASAVAYVLNNAEISNSAYQDEFEVAKRTAGRDLSELVEKGLFEKRGTTGVGVHYVLTERGHDWAKLNNAQGP